MKQFPNIGLYAGSALVGLALSYFVTIVGWNVIEPRMFHCNDADFALLVENVDDHRLAGDKLMPGWTWGEVETARLIYLVCFCSLWAACAIAPRWTVLAKSIENPHGICKRLNSPGLIAAIAARRSSAAATI
jgi:hypothetical protein